MVVAMRRSRDPEPRTVNDHIGATIQPPEGMTTDADARWAKTNRGALVSGVAGAPLGKLPRRPSAVHHERSAPPIEQWSEAERRGHASHRGAR